MHANQWGLFLCLFLAMANDNSPNAVNRDTLTFKTTHIHTWKLFKFMCGQFWIYNKKKVNQIVSPSDFEVQNSNKLEFLVKNVGNIHIYNTN